MMIAAVIVLAVVLLLLAWFSYNSRVARGETDYPIDERLRRWGNVKDL